MPNTNPLRASCEFGRDRALGRLDRTFQPGRLYGLTGPNGSGKSTLLLTLAGELEPISGEVTINGLDPASRDGVGQVLHIGDPVFYPDLSVGEHLELLAAHAALPTREIVDRWSLEPLLELPPRWLSSGQRQRVFLASQLYLPAAVVLIDEPERHLDSHWEGVLCEQLRGLAAGGVAVIVASHSPVVLGACDETVALP